MSAASALQQLGAADNPILGSVPSGKVDPNPVQLTLLGAIDRGLKYNLSLLLSEQGNTSARAARLRALAGLLPDLNARATESAQQINLAAFGFPVQPGQSPVIGPFNVFDVRASVTQDVLNLKSLQNLRAAQENERAAQFSYQNSRDLVVLVVGAQYLQALADRSRVEASQAEFGTAEAIYRQAVDLKNAGMIPGVDLLRAQVQMQAQQQRLLSAQNLLAKQLLQVARVVGLPAGQQFTLTDKIPAPAPLDASFQGSLDRAYQNRADYKQAEALVSAAEHSTAAARAQRFPVLGFTGDYGVIGKNPANSHGTFTAAGAVRVPIFDSGRIRADVEQAESVLAQRRATRDDLRGRIEFEVRSAYLDYETATRQLEVATSALDLSRQQLTQARDRFAAGVATNVEVVQAQEAEATAEENYISSLFGHNFSKLALARAVGVAEQATKSFLSGGKP